MKILNSALKMVWLQGIFVAIFVGLTMYVFAYVQASAVPNGFYLVFAFVFLMFAIMGVFLRTLLHIGRAKAQWQELINLSRLPHDSTVAAAHTAFAIKRYAGDEEMQELTVRIFVSSLIGFYTDVQNVLEELILRLYEQNVSESIIRIVRAPLQRHFDYSLTRHFSSLRVEDNQIFNPCNPYIGAKFFNAIDQAILIEGENKCEEIGIVAVEYLKDHIVEGSSFVDVAFRVFDNFTLRYEVKMSNELAIIVLNGVKYALSKEAEKAIDVEAEKGLKAEKVEDPGDEKMRLDLCDFD